MATPNITSLEDLDKFLEAKILDKKIQTYEDFINLIENYNTSDLETGVNLLYENIINNKKIKLIHDSDADGLGTATLSYRFFKDFIPYGVKIDITDRKQGYGFLPSHVDGYDLYITADNGITSFDACEEVRKQGSKVIITDHHQPEKIDGEYKLPEADALIDPYKPGDPFEFKDISGTVVYFIFLYKLLKKFKLDNKLNEWYQKAIDLLAITTLSDVMPLNISINRFLVKDFIDNHFENSWAQYLKLFKNINSDPVASDFSFTLIPALNATQRMASPIHGFNYLIQEKPEEAQKWMDYLFSLNENRKKVQQELLDYIERYYKDWIKDKKFILIPGKFKKEYDGVLGIIAGRLAEKYKRPCIVCNIKSDGNYAGSGRTTGEINILNILREIREENPEIITHLGGHFGALGVGFKPEHLEILFLKLQEKANEIPDDKFVSKMKADFYININQVQIWDLDIYNYLMKWEPFGHKFKKPLFKTRCYIKSNRIIGKSKNHMTLQLTDDKGIPDIKALWFFHDSSKEQELVNCINQKKPVEIIWQPEIDEYKNQKKLSIRVLDVQFIQNSSGKTRR